MAIWNVQGCGDRMQVIIKVMEQVRIDIASIRKKKEVCGSYVYFIKKVIMLKRQ
jgi:hypothetical protein